MLLEGWRGKKAGGWWWAATSPDGPMMGWDARIIRRQILFPNTSSYLSETSPLREKGRSILKAIAVRRRPRFDLFFLPLNSP